MIDKEWFIGRYKALKGSCKNGCIGCKNVSSKMNCNEIFIRDVIDEYNMKKASDNKFIFKVQGIKPEDVWQILEKCSAMIIL